MIRFKHFCIYILTVVVLFACKKAPKEETVRINRFDNELYNVLIHPDDSSSAKHFLKKYNDFLPVYLSGVLHTPQAGKMESLDVLRSFFTDSTLMKLYADEQEQFKNLTDVESKLGKALTLYKEFFPKNELPVFSMHLSGLSQSVITIGNNVSIAGDKYLGKNYPMYHGYYYDYQIPEMDKAYMVRDALKAYLFGRFPLENQQNLLDQMIYQGKIQYLLSQILPEEKPELLFGYTAKQWEWLHKGEKEIWLYMAENEHLYSADPIVEAKYTGEGPFTSYFGNESPSRIGVWMGYQIVEAYMKKNSITLLQLISLNDSKAILQESGYRP